MLKSAAIIALQSLLPFKLKTNKKGCQRANGEDLDQLIDIFIYKKKKECQIKQGLDCEKRGREITNIKLLFDTEE